MKIIIKIVLFFSICSSTFVQAQFQNQSKIASKKVPSQIKKVTVFTKGAQVNRTAKVPLSAGKTQLIFRGISPKIDKQSIQVKSDDEITILSVIHQTNYLNQQKRQTEISTLQYQKKTLEKQILIHKNQLEIFKNEHEMLLKNQKIGGQNTGIQTSELREAVDFQRQRLTEVFQQKMKIQTQLQKLDSAIKLIDNQLLAFHEPADYMTSEVLVTVLSKKAQTADFVLSYLVDNAGWFATYDLRVKDISHPLELGFKANVFQHSGEDWKNVKLTISNGNPSESGVAPQLEIWKLGFGQPKETQKTNLSDIHYYNKLYKGSQVTGQISSSTGEPLSFVNISVKGTSIGTVSDINGNYTLQLPANAQGLEFRYIGYQTKTIPITSPQIHVTLEEDDALMSEVVVIAYDKKKSKSPKGLKRDKKKTEEKRFIPYKQTYQPTTISFEIEIPYTILNDGKVYAVDIRTQSIPASYEYFAVPKIEESAYLTAQIMDWQSLNLLDGEVNLFFEGAFLGKSILDVSNASDTLAVSLGRDKSIVIQRKNLREYTKKRFLSNFKTESRAYEITVRNNKKQPIKITIQDQFPIPVYQTITVEEQESSGAKVDEQTKILTWKYELPSQKEKKHRIRYSVKYPKNQTVFLD